MKTIKIAKSKAINKSLCGESDCVGGCYICRAIKVLNDYKPNQMSLEELKEINEKRKADTLAKKEQEKRENAKKRIEEMKQRQEIRAIRRRQLNLQSINNSLENYTQHQRQYKVMPKFDTITTILYSWQEKESNA